MEEATLTSGKISDEQFRFLTQYLSTKYGLRIPAEKKTLLESRLVGRLHSLQLKSIEDYISYVFKPNATEEYQLFVDKITTHKTFFFRENYQFEFLKMILPAYCKNFGTNRQLNCWSAGCSTGEEVYTLGIILNESKAQIPLLDYKITGTDISIPSLKTASKGLFSTNELENIPENLLKKYFSVVERSGAALLQFQHLEVVSRIALGVLNLNNKHYNLPNSFDFIFCRNVTIYFDLKTRNEVMSRLVDRLRPGGYLFLGHSETALGMNLPLKSVQPTIYQKM